MPNEINNPLPSPENEQNVPSVDANNSETSIVPPETFIHLETVNATSEAPAVQEAQSGNFITRGLAKVRNGYENLTKKQKDALFLGTLAVSTAILPAIGIVDGGQHVQASEQVLEAEGLGAFAAIEAATVVKFRSLLR